MNSLQKRQAIKDALNPFIQGQQLANALILWDEKYAHHNHFALQHYLRELSNDIEIAHLRSRMLQALVAAFSSLQDIREERQQHAQRLKKNLNPPASADTMSSELKVFVTLIEKLLTSLNDDMSTRTRLYILDNLSNVKVANQERLAIQKWLNRIVPLQADVKLDYKVMQHLINLAYVAICEYQGPIKADQTLQTSVSEIKSEFPEIKMNFLL